MWFEMDAPQSDTKMRHPQNAQYDAQFEHGLGDATGGASCPEPGGAWYPLCYKANTSSMMRFRGRNPFTVTADRRRFNTNALLMWL
jgi:hypothetical protein